MTNPYAMFWTAQAPRSYAAAKLAPPNPPPRPKGPSLPPEAKGTTARRPKPVVLTQQDDEAFLDHLAGTLAKPEASE